MLSAMTNNLARAAAHLPEFGGRKAKAPGQKIIQYGRQVGGGTVHFTANYWRLWESDFKQNSKWGAGRGQPRGLAH